MLICMHQQFQKEANNLKESKQEYRRSWWEEIEKRIIVANVLSQKYSFPNFQYYWIITSHVHHICYKMREDSHLTLSGRHCV